jgi:hypothetical protein
MAKPGDAVEAGLAQEMGPEQRALDLKNAIGGVHDAATDAKRAEDARSSKEEADALAALDAEKKAQIAKQPGFLGSFLSQLATGHDAEHPHIMTPLEELTKKREILGQLQAERSGREEKARTAALYDQNSDLTRNSERALKALGINPGPGYTASQFNDYKALAQLSGTQKHEAAQLLQQQARDNEAARNNRAQTAVEYARINAEKAKAQAAADKGRPIDERDLAQAAATKDLTGQVKDITNLQKNVGFSKVSQLLPHGWQFGAQREADEAREAAAPGAVAAVAPGARGLTPELIKEAGNRLRPHFFESDAEYEKRLGDVVKTAQQHSNTKLDALAASGANPREIADLRPPPAAAPAARPAPAGHVRVIGPKGETGSAPAGSPLPAGWRAG